ncbi:hypothetical protein A4U64_27435 (plasmid) [Rhodococcus sp. WB1]|nr:hypothetical protein A4U64_27435 [Rhodococcus sp. WB1]
MGREILLAVPDCTEGYSSNAAMAGPVQLSEALVPLPTRVPQLSDRCAQFLLYVLAVPMLCT